MMWTNPRNGFHAPTHRKRFSDPLADPVGAGFVDGLARPGGNATGFINFEYSIAGKWLELLKEIAPGVKRVAVIRDPSVAAGHRSAGRVARSS